MPCGLSVASSPASLLFPPRHRKALHEAVLEEILHERVVSSRGRRNPRGVKRKMSSYPLRGDKPALGPIHDIAKHVRMIK